MTTLTGFVPSSSWGQASSRSCWRIRSVQVWIWAIVFVMAGTLPDLAEAIYFSLVTYTTLGYGDVVVGSGVRIFGAMAAVTGLLNFGFSTAFLVGLFARLMRDRI